MSPHVQSMVNICNKCVKGKACTPHVEADMKQASKACVLETEKKETCK